MVAYESTIIFNVRGPYVSSAVNLEFEVNFDLIEALAQLGPGDHLSQKASGRCLGQWLI